MHDLRSSTQLSNLLFRPVPHVDALLEHTTMECTPVRVAVGTIREELLRDPKYPFLVAELSSITDPECQPLLGAWTPGANPLIRSPSLVIDPSNDSILDSSQFPSQADINCRHVLSILEGYRDDNIGEECAWSEIIERMYETPRQVYTTFMKWWGDSPYTSFSGEKFGISPEKFSRITKIFKSLRDLQNSLEPSNDWAHVLRLIKDTVVLKRQISFDNLKEIAQSGDGKLQVAMNAMLLHSKDETVDLIRSFLSLPKVRKEPAFKRI